MGLIADLTDGLYLVEVQHVARTLRKTHAIDTPEIRRIVNRYRIGEQEDYWGSLDLKTLDRAPEWFKQTEGVKGQDEAVRSVQDVLTLARSGLSGMASGTLTKPKGILFFAGPTGVGKTFLAKKLAKFLFSTEEAFIRFDMSEFKEEHTVSKFIGSPPGYVGYEQGGMLTNAVRERPFAVVLFDEIEKAHPRIMDIFLQLLDEGRLTDSRGQTIFFTETIIIFTSNIGCRTTDGRGNPMTERQNLDKILNNASLLPEKKQEEIGAHFRKSVEEFFLLEISRPELLNRIGSHIIPFNYIHDPSTQREIVASHLARIKSDFEDKHRQSKYSLTVDDQVARFLVKQDSQKIAAFGGRAITDSLNQKIMIALARSVLQAEFDGTSGVEFHVRLQGSELVVDTK
jgi:ATP-dependent Clp protease ATP-binding subunit ClpA